MNKCVTVLFFFFLALPLHSLFAMEEGEKPPSSSTTTPKYDFTFFECVEGLTKRTLIEKKGIEYAILKTLPDLKDPSLCSGGANPCYEYGLGPKLLKVEEVNYLPKNVNWICLPLSIHPHQDNTFIMVRFTANNNPDWETIHTNYKSSTDLEPYWHSEPDPNSTGNLNTVNFLLKRI